MDSPSLQTTGPVKKVSTFLGYFRWAFMPLGLFALVAVGVHAAADTIDDRILWLVDRADAWLDGLFASYSVTQPLVSWVRTEQRTLIARALTLALELVADGVLAVPVLGYREEDAPERLRRASFLTRPRTWRVLFARLWRQPTLVRVARPLMTAAVVLAGGCAIARMVEGALYLSLRQLIAGEELAASFSRLTAIAVLLLVLASFGWRAVLRSLQHADRLSEEALPQVPETAPRRTGRVVWAALRVGLVGSALCAPVALAALFDASPLLSFLR